MKDHEIRNIRPNLEQLAAKASPEVKNAFEAARTSADPIRRALVGRVEQKFSEIKAHFQMSREEGLSKLNEKLFVQYWLPYFCGEVEDPQTCENLRLNWIKVAGSPSNAVLVVDDAGETLFEVPGIHSSNIIRPIVARSRNISSDVQNAIARESMGPLVSQGIISKALYQRSQALLGDMRSIEDDQKWRAIFVRYGKKPKAAQEASGEGGGGDDGFTMEF